MVVRSVSAMPAPDSQRARPRGRFAHAPRSRGVATHAGAISSQRSSSDADVANLPRVETVYRPGAPLDVHATLSPLSNGPLDPTFRVHPHTRDIWRTTRTEAGAATLVIRPVREGARVIAWGPGAEHTIERVPELLGRGDDRDGFDCSGVPWLAEVDRCNPGLRLLRTNAVFEAMAPAILAQKVTGIEAKRAFRILHAWHADEAPGPAHLMPPGMRAPLSPEQWRRIPSWDWHRAGVDAARSATVIRAAERAAALERTLPLGRASEEVTGRLRSIPGIGVWTAAETTQRSHGDPDAPSFDDYHLAAAVGWAFVGEPVDDEGMREILEPWRGHRQRVMRLLAKSGRGKPKRGPRMAIQDHRAI